MPTTAISCPKARIGNRITDREMVHNLSLLGRKAKVAVNLFIVKRADTGGSQPERFCGNTQTMANGTCFKMHIPITTIAMSADGTLDIADHRERHAGITRKFLPEAQACGRNTLVASVNLLQLTGIGPEPVNAGLKPVYTMRIQVELDRVRTGEISKQPPHRGRQYGRELRHRHRLHSTPKVEC